MVSFIFFDVWSVCTNLHFYASIFNTCSFFLIFFLLLNYNVCTLNILDTFEETVKLIHENCINRFHPTLPVLVSGSTHLTFFDAKDGITQFSNWNERQCKLKGNVVKSLCSLEWNVSYNLYNQFE